MAEHCTSCFIYLLLLVFAGSLAEYNSSRSYIEFGLDNAAVCNPSSDKPGSLEELRKYKESAIMIKPSHVFDSWRVRYSKHCKFKVKASKGDGLSAVIQKMSFRRNGSECLDYIRFTPEYGAPSEKYCGKLDNYNGYKHYISSMELAEYQLQNSDYQNIVDGMFEEFSSQGKITTEIFISRQLLRTGETLDLVVIYTPYKDCEKVEAGQHFWSAPPYFSTCINSKFVCDGYSNCASLLCSDESNCTSVVNRVVSVGTGTKVTAGAAATIFLCFLIFVLCLWICRKHKKLCWSPDCAGPSTTMSGSTSGLPMERGEQSAPNPPYVSTAPMLEVAVPASVHDKDLPPSYDSLFPSQVNAANA